MIRRMYPFVPSGSVVLQPSKSVLHRALICAALADGTSRIGNYAQSEDILATMRVLEGLGLAAFRCIGRDCIVTGGQHMPPSTVLDCGESGTTLRLLFPLALTGTPHTLTGHGRLMHRPFGPYEELCAVQGIELLRTDDKIEVCGKLHAGTVQMAGNVSSQFISGLLLGFAGTDGASQICLTSHLESAPYVDITRSVMSAFGVLTDATEDGFSLAGPQQFVPCSFTVEGDYSHAAFFAVAAALCGEVTLQGLTQNSAQGDREILPILESAGASVAWNGQDVLIKHRTPNPISVDVSQIPDLVPILAVLACGARGRSVLYNAARLRLKESDRLAAMREELTKLGAAVEERSDALIIEGTGRLHGGTVDSHNDHRVVMALSVASLIADGPVEIRGTEAVRKSAPAFFDEWAAIGGN